MPLPQRVRLAEQLLHRLEWESLDRGAIRRLVELAHDETRAGANLAENSPRAQRRTVELTAAGDLVFCGAALLPLVASAFGIRGGLHLRATDGASVAAGSTLAAIAGPAGALQSAAPVVHAFLSRLCGIATFARHHADVLGGGRTRLLDNCATTPGWSALERFALACGGAWSGGDGSSRIRIEAGARDTSRLGETVRRARESTPDVPVELTVLRPEDVAEAVAAGPDMIRLEHFGIEALRDAVACAGGRVFVEAHGGITLADLAAHAGLGLDFVSVEGLVTHAMHAPIGWSWRD
jgi:nicotinate-nucleotide pyrophosphorylase (carboxylating)